MNNIKQLFPKPILTFFRRLRERWFQFVDSHSPYLNSIIYCGYRVYFTRGEGLISRIRFGNPDRIYERELSEALVDSLVKSRQPVLVDIGANIGLMSLYQIVKNPQLHVYAFEPGPHQHKLFSITLLANQLENRITLLDAALGAQEGVASFSVHTDSRDSSGDGFIDTRRAGPTQSISVRITTLDSWWAALGKPAITTLKIDTEGSELWVLQGAKQILSEVHPEIFLEISLANLKNYPYSALDIFEWLHQTQYQLYTLSGQLCQAKNLESILVSTDTFMARYQKTL